MSNDRGSSPPNLHALFQVSNSGEKDDLPTEDRTTITQLVIEIEKIKPYDRNPRRRINPKYDLIRESIRAQRGLNNPLTITRRPGDDLYMVQSGGNTRLAILKELWQETQDEAYHKIQCLFIPWVSESHVLTAHLVENELRGEMNLIDKAFALVNLKRQIEKEAHKTLSRSEFQRKLSAMGFSVSRRQMIRLEYAAEFLEPLIPQSLQSGLGPGQIDQIRSLEKAYGAYCQSSADFSLAFEPFFCDVLSQQDQDCLDLTAVRRELDQWIADATSEPLNRIRQEIDALLHEKSGHHTEDESDPVGETGRQLSIDPILEKSPSPPLQSVPANPVSNDTTPNKTSGRESNNDRQGNPEPSPPSKPPSTELETSSEGDQSSSVVSEPTDFLDPSLNTEKTRLPAKTNLKFLRSRCYILALRFAKSFGFQSLLKSAASGHGFFIDLPVEAINDEALWWAWWLLFALSEQAINEKRLLSAPSGLQLPSMICAERMNEVFDRAGTPPETSLIGHAFLLSPKLSERSFQDLLLLMESCRVLRTHFDESELWQGLEPKKRQDHPTHG